MNCNITYSRAFGRAIKHLAKKYPSIGQDLACFVEEIKHNPFSGKDLGSGIRKVRMPIASKGKGKSGGARVITFMVEILEHDISIEFLTIYDKSERVSITSNEIKQILKESGYLT